MEEYICVAIFAYYDGYSKNYVEASAVRADFEQNGCTRLATAMSHGDVASAFERLKPDLATAFRDPYGPDVVQIHERIDRKELIGVCPLYEKVAILGDKSERFRWVERALHQIELAQAETVNDGQLNSRFDEWAPLDLDLASEHVSEVSETLDELIEAVEADNGYAVTLPAERNAVLESLKAGRANLRAGEIARRAVSTLIVEPAKQVASKFKNAATGILANKLLELVTKFFGSLGG